MLVPCTRCDFITPTLLCELQQLDISDELRRAMEMVRGQGDKVRVVLNKVGTLSPQQLLRVYGALMWSLGKIINTPEVMRVYVCSFGHAKEDKQTLVPAAAPIAIPYADSSSNERRIRRGKDQKKGSAQNRAVVGRPHSTQSLLSGRKHCWSSSTPHIKEGQESKAAAGEQGSGRRRASVTCAIPVRVSDVATRNALLWDFTRGARMGGSRGNDTAAHLKQRKDKFFEDYNHSSLSDASSLDDLSDCRGERSGDYSEVSSASCAPSAPLPAVTYAMRLDKVASVHSDLLWKEEDDLMRDLHNLPREWCPSGALVI